MFPTARPVRRLPKLFAAIAFASVAISGFADPAADVLDETDVRVQAVVTTQDEVTPSLMQRPEILGTAVGIDEVGNPILKVYVDREAADVEEAVRSLPHESSQYTSPGGTDGRSSCDGEYGKTNTTYFTGNLGRLDVRSRERLLMRRYSWRSRTHRDYTLYFERLSRPGRGHRTRR
jgi:hypothetical protein